MSDVLQELSGASDSSGDEESDGEETKEGEAVDEDDEAEKANLPHYVSRFKVGVGCCFCLSRLPNLHEPSSQSAGQQTPFPVMSMFVTQIFLRRLSN